MEAFKGFMLQIQESIIAFGHTVWGSLSDPWIASGLAVILGVFLLVFFFSKKQPSRIRAFSNGSGYVEISRTALVDIIRAKSEQVDIERKPGVTLRTRRGKLHVDVRIRLLPSRRLTEVSEILQQHLRDVLQNGLGIRKLGNINVMVIGVRVKTGKSARKSLPLNPHSSPSEPSAEKTPSESATFEVVDEAKKEVVDQKKEQKVVSDGLRKTEDASSVEKRDGGVESDGDEPTSVPEAEAEAEASKFSESSSSRRIPPMGNTDPKEGKG